MAEPFIFIGSISGRIRTSDTSTSAPAPALPFRSRRNPSSVSRSFSGVQIATTRSGFSARAAAAAFAARS